MKIFNQNLCDQLELHDLTWKEAQGEFTILQWRDGYVAQVRVKPRTWACFQTWVFRFDGPRVPVKEFLT